MADALPLLPIEIHGEGASILLIHGSAADRTTWTIQVAGLRGQARLLVYDRRGTAAAPLPSGVSAWTVEDHAGDAAALIAAHGRGPVIACGSSFGAVVVLELLRSRPDLVRGAVLLEPPLAARDDVPAVPPGVVDELDGVAAREGGAAAGERFLRIVLGDAAFERMPRPFRERATASWPQIRGDVIALDRYRVRYGELAGIARPVLLLGGERSAAFYRPTLEALVAALGNATLEILAGAGHMMHAEAHRAFNARLIAFTD